LMATFNMGWILDDITVCMSFEGACDDAEPSF